MMTVYRHRFDPATADHKRFAKLGNITDKQVRVLFWNEPVIHYTKWTEAQWSIASTIFDPDSIAAMRGLGGAHWIPKLKREQIVEPREELWVEMTHINCNILDLERRRLIRVLDKREVPSLHNKIRIRKALIEAEKELDSHR